MATTPGPSRSCTADSIILETACDGLPIAFGADIARHLERTCQVLALLIDWSLTAVFLVAGGVQAAFLLFMLAGQTLG
ncbi:MAG TPA: hypothetical protein VFP00_07925 [Burkholderiales bacterium]|nr:hypothetical protein [Burkholderiales bacterium]